MYKQYDKDTLRHLQLKELEILKEFDTIAKENDIEYFAIGGTAIGAVRHKGFIPWDDDIDLAISRSGYERLEKIISEQYSDKYTLLSAKTDENYPILEGHLQLNGTRFVDESSKNLKCNMGIFIDFFIYDNISDDEIQRKKQIKDATFWGKMLILRTIAFPVLPYGGLFGKLLHCGTAFVHFLLCLFGLSREKLYNKVTEASTRFNDVQTENVALFRDLYIERGMMKKEALYPLQRIAFEDMMLFVPNKNHELLCAYYGDYMELPPEDKRVNHAPIVLDFGEREDKI